MSIPFLIAGLPRSRTAWLSVFFDCAHEGMAGCATVAEMLDRVGNNSDSSLCLYADEVIAAVEADRCRLVVIQRSEAEARVSLRLCWGGQFGLTADQIIDGSLEGYEKLRNYSKALQIPFGELSSANVMRALYEFVRPGEVFPAERNYRLQALQITQDFRIAASRVKAA